MHIAAEAPSCDVVSELTYDYVYMYVLHRSISACACGNTSVLVQCSEVAIHCYLSNFEPSEPSLPLNACLAAALRRRPWPCIYTPRQIHIVASGPLAAAEVGDEISIVLFPVVELKAVMCEVSIDSNIAT